MKDKALKIALKMFNDGVVSETVLQVIKSAGFAFFKKGDSFFWFQLEQSKVSKFVKGEHVDANQISENDLNHALEIKRIAKGVKVNKMLKISDLSIDLF